MAVPRHRELSATGGRARSGSELGASFGSDTNAPTDADQHRLYARTCPTPTREPLDTSLAVLAEMMTRARFEPAAVDAERPVVLAEKGRRPELGVSACAS